MLDDDGIIRTVVNDHRRVYSRERRCCIEVQNFGRFSRYPCSAGGYTVWAETYGPYCYGPGAYSSEVQSSQDQSQYHCGPYGPNGTAEEISAAVPITTEDK